MSYSQFSEDELRQLLGAIPDFLAIIDCEGRYLRFAAQPRDLLFRSVDELVGRTFAEVFPPDIAQRFLDVVTRALKEKKSVCVEYELNVVAGARWFEASVSPLDEKRVVWLARDMSDKKNAERALREAEAKYRMLFEEAIEGIFQTTVDGRYLTANPMLAKIYGYDSPEELQHNITEIAQQLYVETERREEFRGQMQQHGAVTHFESQIRRRDGSVIWISENARELRSTRGELLGYEGTVVDITDRVLAEQNLRASETKLRQIIEHSNNLFYSHTPNNILTYLSPQTRQFLDCEPEELLGTSWISLTTNNPVNLEGLKHTERAIETGIAQPVYQLEFKGRNGRIIWVDVNEAPIVEHGKTVAVVGAFIDITERRAVENELKHQAFHDSLTNLPNRALFMDRVEHALARAARQGGINAVLFLDLDRFKIVNDSLGHDTGDALLQQVAERLLRCLRPGDTVARLGGDEFTILMEDIHGVNDAIAVAERIASELQVPFMLRGQEIVTTTSIGIALTGSLAATPPETEEEATAESILRDADVAMYRAKNYGKARYEVFNAGMNAHAVERLALETDLWQAVTRNELQVFYQPKIDLQTQSIIGFEALVRWQSPSRGMVLPQVFIGIAEEIGLINTIGEWVLQTACRQARVWQESAPLEISVNLSGRQLQQPNLVEIVRDILQETQLPPHLLNLEVTESVLMEDAESAAKMLRTLKELGICLSIDDFGTGYSSLSYLRRFPFDVLKIDRSFVQNLGTDPDDTAIVKAVISLANSLGLEVVAEGVEQLEQAVLLREMGCGQAQGYYYARPLASDSTSFLLNRFRPQK
ncbi:MAG TPA: EAL domain-containing protein [Abditibacteriaceae bacterium]|jgi:diguanylate cyclase (GGDEF)-like protein/PAS domain S-box-containing protein